MSFEAAAWLWALLLLPLLVLGSTWATRRDRARTLAFVARGLWPRVLARPHERWQKLRLALIVLGASGLILALARPQWGIVREKIEREGVDVVFLLDTSGSMATEDVPPNRFFLARAALTQLLGRLEGDRLALVAFEGEAYPLVPLTLDADALGLFLETIEPGSVPSPGTSLGLGLAKGLDLFVDQQRRNKVMVLVSDGEDLEGDVEMAIAKAKQAGVIVHTVAVGSEQGQPVPHFDREGQRVGYKKQADGSAVVSRLNAATLDAIARGTGGRSFRITAADSTLAGLADAIEGLEQKTLAKEYAYRRKERFQLPLALSLASFTLAALLPWPRRRPRTPVVAKAAALLLAVLAGGTGFAQPTPTPTPTPTARPAAGGVADELLLRPRRLTGQGQADWSRGNHPAALQAFEEAARVRPKDPQARFNLADGLYKNGRYDEAAELWKALGDEGTGPLNAAARYNLGNARYQKKDYPGAVEGYRGALRLQPNDAETRRNLELALRAIQEQQQQQQKDQKEPKDQKDQQQKQDSKDQQQQQKPDQQKNAQNQPRKSAEQQEQERFQKEAGMPKERAEQLLDALQQNEKAQQKKLLAGKAKPREGKDW